MDGGSVENAEALFDRDSRRASSRLPSVLQLIVLFQYTKPDKRQRYCTSAKQRSPHNGLCNDSPTAPDIR